MIFHLYVSNVRRLCVVVDSLISAGKVCDCVRDFHMVLGGMWSRGFGQSIP